MANKASIFRFADVEVREREFSLIKAGEALPVEPKAFRVLLILLRNPQTLITKEELLNAVWGDTAVSENSLTRSIALLRRLLGDDTRNPRFIETVATVGYRLICRVEVSEDALGNIEGAGGTNGPDNGDVRETASNGGSTATSADPQGQIKNPATAETARAKAAASRIRGFRLRWVLVAAVFVAVLVTSIWYLRRPLPPPRISDYVQITHDGNHKALGGTDGNRLYFTQFSPSPRFIGQVDTKGGETAQIPVAVPGLPYLIGVSPDGSNLLVATLKQDSRANWVWIVPSLGGSLRRLDDAHDAAFSSDGKSIVYTTPEGDIFVVRNDGTGARKVASESGFIDNLAWSPDGGTIRFTKDNLIWEISSSGSNLHQLLPGWHVSSHHCCGRWTTDGKFFVFLSEPGGSKRLVSELWAIDQRRKFLRRPRTEPVQLTTGPISWSEPVPSKDGTRIFAEGITNRGELSRFDAKTHQISPFLGGISAEFVSFSTDGQSVAYVSFPEGVLWKANRDGSNRVRLSDPPLVPTLPRWSPDGAQIVFTDLSSLDHPKIYIVSTEGSSPRRLLPDDKGKESDPDWSADGRKIVFSSAMGGNPKSDLRILDMTSQRVTALPGSVGTFAPRWSPDGRSIAAVSSDFLNMMILDVASARWSKFPQKSGVAFPEWSRDSQFVYFLHYSFDDPGVLRMHIKGGEVERIVDLKGFHTTGAVGIWLGLDLTDSPMLLRDVGSDDIYALSLEDK